MTAGDVAFCRIVGGHRPPLHCTTDLRPVVEAFRFSTASITLPLGLAYVSAHVHDGVCPILRDTGLFVSMYILFGAPTCGYRVEYRSYRPQNSAGDHIISFSTNLMALGQPLLDVNA